MPKWATETLQGFLAFYVILNLATLFANALLSWR